MATILFTGFPGFLGSELLPKVLARDPDARAVCLVQDRFRPLAEERVAALGAATPGLAERIDLGTGDITRPDLGLGDEGAALLAEVTEVYHLAAVYDLGVAGDLARRVNVDGTRHILRFCEEAAALERLHYVSTCYVSGRWPGIFRETDLVKGQRFHNHYEATKYRAEELVATARDGGLPVTIYRPSVVGGDSDTGATQKYDGPYFVMRWLLKQGRVAGLPVVGDPAVVRFNVVPRDFVVAGMLALSGRTDTVGGTYALADPEPYTVRELLDLIADETRQRIVPVPLTLGLAKGALGRIPGLADWMGIPAAAVDYFTHPTHYTTDEADPLLADSGVSRPDQEAWFRAMVAYVRANPDVPSAAMV